MSKKESDKLMYPRSSTAPVFVGDKVSANRLQSFIEMTMSENNNNFIDAIKNQKNLTVILTKQKLREYFNPVTHNYMRDVEDACNHLLDKRIKIISGSKTKLLNVFTQCAWDENSDNIQIDVSYEALCAYNYLEKNTKCLFYDGGLIRNFKHATTSYFYDLAMRSIGQKCWYFDVSKKDLKEQFLKESTRKRKNSTSEKRVNCTDDQIRSKWINPAFEELEEKFNLGLLDFYLEIAENGIHYEEKKTPGRKKIESYTISIVQLIPNIEEEMEIIRQEIKFFLQTELKDTQKVLRLMVPWNSKKVDLTMLCKLKKKIDAYPDLVKKNQIKSRPGWIHHIMDINTIHESIKDSIISDNNTAISKWESVKQLIKSQNPNDNYYDMIENFVIHNYIDESNIVDIQMISETRIGIEFMFNDKTSQIIKSCIKEIFGKDVIVNLVYTRNGVQNTYAYIERTLFED